MSNKEDTLTLKGKVLEALPNATFKVTLENGCDILCYLSGRMRKHNIRVLVGDHADIELSVYNLNLGRIIFRYK